MRINTSVEKRGHVIDPRLIQMASALAIRRQQESSWESFVEAFDDFQRTKEVIAHLASPPARRIHLASPKSVNIVSIVRKALRQLEASVKNLYRDLSFDQRKKADILLLKVFDDPAPRRTLH